VEVYNQENILLKTIIIDADETLIYTRARPNNSVASEEFKKISVPVQWHGEIGYALLRPSAMEFLEQLSLNYRLITLTQGIVSWQEAVYDRLGISKYISRVYGWNDTRTEIVLPQLPIGEFVMVAHHEPTHPLTAAKAGWLGVEFTEKNFIHCEPWYGGADPKPLTDLLDPIINLLLPY
jgi:hypothetical protein